MMQTRSAAKRLVEKEIESGKSTEEIPIEHPQRNDAAPPAKKPRRGGTPVPKKRRRGKPGEICQLNLDVLFLIAAYIHPIDLLNLARTCKSLRQLLMDKSSAFVWKEARRQVTGLPDCPTDLTEPEYANLVFCARCYGCGKYTKTVLWEMRCRYCPDCRVGQLCSLSSCHEVIRRNYVLAREYITIRGETTILVDRQQMESFMQAYKHSSDEKQFLRDKIEQFAAIYNHARQCEKWQRDRASERKIELGVHRRERDNSIFERLKQLGYEREVAYFSRHEIKLSCKALFGKSKPLTDKEWNKIWPEWIGTMNALRYQRLEGAIYQPRRHLLSSEYANYLSHPSPNAPVFDFLPHVADLACFPPFRDVIRASEETQTNDKQFESAFARLPGLVNDWKKKLDTEVVELVKIPSHLSSKSTSNGLLMSSGNTTGSESFQTATDKLRLACALFRGSERGVFTYREVFSVSMCFAYPRRDERCFHHSGSIKERYGIEYIQVAPYVIHACGLDPNVATVDDMDRRDPRLKCLHCLDSRVRCWRDAVWHAHVIHNGMQTGPEWQLVSDEHVVDSQAAERSPCSVYRCLLCLPCVGDAKHLYDLTPHLKYNHNIKTEDIQEGVHYVSVGMAVRY